MTVGLTRIVIVCIIMISASVKGKPGGGLHEEYLTVRTLLCGLRFSIPYFGEECGWVSASVFHMCSLSGMRVKSNDNRYIYSSDTPSRPRSVSSFISSLPFGTTQWSHRSHLKTIHPKISARDIIAFPDAELNQYLDEQRRGGRIAVVDVKDPENLTQSFIQRLR